MRSLFFFTDRRSRRPDSQASPKPGSLSDYDKVFDGYLPSKKGLTSTSRPLGDDRDPRALLDLYLRDYAELRADNRQAASSSGTLLAVSVAALGTLISLFLPAVELRPNALYLAVPSVAIALAAVATSQVVVTTMRSYYLRRLELFIHEKYGSPRVPLDESQSAPAFLHIPSFAHIDALINGSRANFWRFRATTFLVLLPIAIAIGLVIVVSLSRLENLSLRLFGGLFYFGIGFLLLGAIIFGIVSPQRMWVRLNLLVGQRFAFAEIAHGRAPLRYLFIPRRVDLVVKGFTFVPLAIFAGYALNPVPQSESLLQVVLIIVLAFEFFIYQSRYMWNDLRDLREDVAHPAARERHRLPSNLDAMGATTAIFANLLRLLFGLLMAWLYLPRLRNVIFIATALIFGAATIYEYAKHRNKIIVLRRNGMASLTLAAVCMYFFVGAGYAIRTGLGLWVGSGGRLPAIGYCMAIVELWLFGMMLVLMTWVIDSCGFLEQGPRGLAEVIRVKPHYLPLMRAAALLDRKGQQLIAPENALCHQPFKANSLARPWGLLLLFSTVLGAGAGWSLLGIEFNKSFWIYGLTAVTLSVILVAGKLKLWAGVLLALIVMGLNSLLLLEKSGASGVAVFAAGVLVLITHMSYVALMQLTEEARRRFEQKIDGYASSLRALAQRLGRKAFCLAFGAAAEIILRQGEGDAEKATGYIRYHGE